MARTFFGHVRVGGRDAVQVLCMARPWSRVETSSFGSSSLGDDSQSALGMGGDLGLSAQARLFAVAIWRMRWPVPRAAGIMGIPKKRRRHRQPGRVDRNIPDLLQRDFPPRNGTGFGSRTSPNWQQGKLNRGVSQYPCMDLNSILSR
ncbi:MAG: hypothetical protein F4W92_00705 [Gammaproteobacteria bacterium]|nr:hypothetical protein [Gammaproteobacteria bacterium]